MSLKYICDKCQRPILKEFYQISATPSTIGEQAALRQNKPTLPQTPVNVADLCSPCYRKVRRDLTGEAI